MRLGRVARFTLAVAIAAGGCTGTVGAGGDQGAAPPEPGGSTRAPRTPGNGQPREPGPGVPPVDPVATPAPAQACGRVGPAPLRRLTRGEYDSTIEDLLGVTGRPADALPPDASKDGFDNNATVQSTKALHATGYIQSAEAVAGRAKLEGLVPCALAAGDEACAKAFIDSFGPRAFRRPLRPEESAAFLAFWRSHRDAGFETAVRLTLQAFLASPQFLYRLELGPVVAGKPSRLTPHELASRLSYFITGSMPDAALFEAAAAGALTTREQVLAHADRLLAGPRARARLRHLYGQLLTLDELTDVQRDAKAYPGWSQSLVGSMRKEIETFVERITFDESGSYATLVSAPFRYVDAALAKYHGLPGVTGNAFQKVSIEGARHAGVLTAAGVLTMNSKADQTSPIYRGRWVREHLLCQPLPPPPPGLDAQTPAPSPTSTSRQRHERHSSDPACVGCHRLIDGVGFLFENYDATGKWRDMEAGQAVDASGEVNDAGDLTGRYRNAAEMGQRLAESQVGQSCQVRMFFRWAHGRAETEDDRCALDWIEGQFRAAGGDLRQLVRAIAQSDAFLYRMGGN